MVKWVNDLTAHKNFRFGGEAEIHQILFTEKSQDAAKFPYALHFATKKEKVGCFQFSFLPKASVRASSFIVIPEGYSYRQRTYSSLNSLIAAIKAEMSKQVGVAPPQGSREAAKQGRSAKERSKESLPPYAAATSSSSSSRQPQASRPPYAAAAPAAVRPPPSSLPPYAGAGGGMPLPPYAGAQSGPPRPPYAAPPQPMMPPYAGGMGGGMMPPPPRPSYPMYGQQQQQQSYAPYAGPQYQQQPYPPQSLPAPPPPQQPQVAPAPAGATSGYVHPSRLGIVSHAPPAAAPQQQQPYQRTGSRWGNTRNDDMQM